MLPQLLWMLLLLTSTVASCAGGRCVGGVVTAATAALGFRVTLHAADALLLLPGCNGLWLAIVGGATCAAVAGLATDACASLPACEVQVGPRGDAADRRAVRLGAFLAGCMVAAAALTQLVAAASAAPAAPVAPESPPPWEAGLVPGLPALAWPLVALGGVLGAALCSWLSDATILVSATLGAWGAATALMGMGVPRWAAVAAATAAAALGAVLQRYMGCRTRSAFESASHKR